MFKVTYKGNSMPMDFSYICTTCKHTSVIEQRRSDDMDHRMCNEKGCDGHLLRHITKAPSLGADYRQDQLARNIGWDK